MELHVHRRAKELVTSAGHRSDHRFRNDRAKGLVKARQFGWLQRVIRIKAGPAQGLGVSSTESQFGHGAPRQPRFRREHLPARLTRGNGGEAKIITIR